MVDFSDKIMAFLGDSITFGFIGSSSIPMETPYPNEVKNILNLKRVDNFGVCPSPLAGIEYSPMWLRCEDLTENYHLIGVLGGVNDFFYCYPLGNINSTNTNTIYGALNYIAKTLKQNHKNCFIFFMTPLKCDLPDISYLKPNYVGIKLIDICEAIKNVCQKFNIPVLDLYESDFNPKTQSHNHDGVHPNQEYCNNFLAPQIVKFILENFNKNK